MLLVFLEPLLLKRLWIFNLGLIVLYVSLSVGFPFLKGSVLEYSGVKPLPFDGTVAPIAYVPNWLSAGNLDKKLRYENVAASEFVPVGEYDPEVFGNSDPRDKIALLARGTYITPYMGSYRMNFQEYDGSHLWVDIRAPLGTPVVSIANGVITKVKDTENADGKYVIIRHDGVVYQGRPAQSYYSAYLHLESISVLEGTAVTKWQFIGKVGMTGITTTPHLHFQIDTSDAPFHSYWPYSFKDLRELGLDFFEAVNVGLGKENAMKYTVSPLAFVQSLARGNTAPIPQSVSASTLVNQIQVAALPAPSTQQQFITAVPVAVLPTPVKSTQTSLPALTSAPVLPEFIISPALPATPVKISSTYIDLRAGSSLARAANYLKANSVPALQGESVFRPSQSMTRREAILYLAGVFSVETQWGAVSSFADVPADDAIVGYLATLQARGVIQSGWVFRPNESITKNELVVLLSRLSWTTRWDENLDILMKDFVEKTRYRRAAISPDRAVLRSDAARMIELYRKIES